MCETMKQVADTDIGVLVHGESGTGKELVTKALHFNSRRRKRPFLAINCAALPETLVESELFGHERGAFTGATRQRAGYFEQALGGTLLLDEIGDMSLALPGKATARPAGARDSPPRGGIGRSRSTCASSRRRTGISTRR